MDLTNKVIAVTGGAQGLGFAMAKGLAERGARLALIDMNAEPLEQAAASLSELGVEVATFVANVADEDSVIAAFDGIIDQFGTLQGLINNAGITRDGLMLKVKDGEVTDRMSLSQWQMVIDVNLTGVFLCGREAATRMIQAQSEGVIINISSISRAGNFGQTNYSATKAGVAAMAVTWAKELARHNIRTGAIAPGFMATEMVASMKPEALEKM
ncbi:MAG: SDR family NAD(P)-dependent oxidoreductase, partial [Halieaceae bacterium]|nr:SDR family NAD(P)-dependent oxidoreductase [Halieaceae bacterium]